MASLCAKNFCVIAVAYLRCTLIGQSWNCCCLGKFDHFDELTKNGALAELRTKSKITLAKMLLKIFKFSVFNNLHRVALLSKVTNHFKIHSFDTHRCYSEKDSLSNPYLPTKRQFDAWIINSIQRSFHFNCDIVTFRPHTPPSQY